MILQANPNLPDKNKKKLFEDLRAANRFVSENRESMKNYVEFFIPKLPNWTNKELNYKDNFGNDAKVNLFKVTCTCQDYEDRKQFYTNRDIRSCCKHIAYKFSSSTASKCLSQLLQILLQAAAIRNEEFLYKYTIKEKDIYIGFSRNTNWINVYAQPNTNYIQYSYNPVTNKWSYGSSPAESISIEHYIRTTMEMQLPFMHKFIEIKKVMEK